MNISTIPAGRRIGGHDPPSDDLALLDVQQVAALLHCSTRHVYRLSDAGLMPRPFRLGSLVRWSRRDLDAWIADGCHPIDRENAKGSQ